MNAGECVTFRIRVERASVHKLCVTFQTLSTKCCLFMFQSFQHFLLLILLKADGQPLPPPHPIPLLIAKKRDCKKISQTFLIYLRRFKTIFMLSGQKRGFIGSVCLRCEMNVNYCTLESSYHKCWTQLPM
jgi:hypothetical protein